MTAPETIVRSFRRQLWLTRVLRAGLILLMLTLFGWGASLPDPRGRQMLFILSLAGVFGWVMFLMQILRQTREVHASTLLLATGQFDRAEKWLSDCLNRFSLSTQVKLMAMQQFAVLSLRRNEPQGVVTLCREVLRHPRRRLRSVWINTRLMLTEGLLDLDQLGDAYEALRPVYDSDLSLVERMKLLPVQLRYELAADHAAWAVRELPEKVRLAELFPSLQACFVHGLLAVACRREGMERHANFLRQRAALYHDLEPLTKRYSVLAPLLTVQA